MSDKILRLPDVIAYTGLSRSTIYHKMSLDEFPQSISLGLRSVGWLSSEIFDWVQSRVDASRSDESE